MYRYFKITGMAFLFIVILSSFAFPEETLTITTYYPSSSGSYNELGVNKLAVDINGVAVPSEYDAMNNGDAHIGRSLIVGAGGGSGFAYDDLIGPPDNRPGDGSVLIKGSVGIGTTSPPNAQLEIVKSTAVHEILRSTSNTGYTSLRLYNDQNINIRALEIDYSGSAYASAIQTNGPTGESAAITTTGAYPLTFGTNNTFRMGIDSGGDVGIGTITPRDKLHLKTTNMPAGDTELVLEYAAAGPGDVSGEYALGVFADGKFKLRGGPPSYPFFLTADATGNVGIGIDSPSVKLQVKADATEAIRASTESGSAAVRGTHNAILPDGSGFVYGLLGARDPTGSKYAGVYGNNGGIPDAQFAGYFDGGIIVTSGNATRVPGISGLQMYYRTLEQQGWIVSYNTDASDTTRLVLYGNPVQIGAGTARDLFVTGNISANGTITAGGAKPFEIDHPLDPKNKILRHIAVESPEVMLIYKGKTRLTQGRAEIGLPEYFDALTQPKNRNVSLTPINSWSPLYVEKGVVGNKFVVKTTKEGDPEQEFDWIVYAVRNDAYIKKHPIIIEEEKSEANGHEKGKYIHPDLFN